MQQFQKYMQQADTSKISYKHSRSRNHASIFVMTDETRMFLSLLEPKIYPILIVEPINRATSSIKWIGERSKDSFFASNLAIPQVESHIVENTENLPHSPAEGFLRNAIKGRNEIPMTSTAAAFQRAHKNSGTRLRRWLHVKFGNGSS